MNDSEKVKMGDKINDFVRKNRKLIFITAGLLLFLLVGTAVFLAGKDHFEKKAIAEVEELTTRFSDLSFGFAEESSAEEVNALIGDLEAFAQNRKGFPGGKAWSLAGQIYSQREEWAKAEEAWQKAAAAGAKTYLAPIALFNAATAAEEQGKPEKAIEFLRQCISSGFEFPAAPRAQFSIGRLYEQLGDSSAAIEAYRAVLLSWQDMPVWQQLARNRIAAIEILE